MSHRDNQTDIQIGQFQLQNKETLDHIIPTNNVGTNKIVRPQPTLMGNT